jgi:hypothetical protein
VPWLFLVTDIVLRCVIRGRPADPEPLRHVPVRSRRSRVGAAIVAEIVSRRRFVLSIAPVFGALLIALARASKSKTAKISWRRCRPCLDTNYYLATHVTSINIGYAASMFASFVGTAWLLMQAAGIPAQRRRVPQVDRAGHVWARRVSG